MYYVYILLSLKNGRRYLGHTNNLERRIKEHNNGETRSIKAYIPYKLVYVERYMTREEASKREKYFKSGAGREKLNRILDNKNTLTLKKDSSTGD